MHIGVDCHWEVCAHTRCRHGLAARRREIDNGDLVGIRHIDKHSRLRLIEPKTFGMGLKTNVARLGPGRRIDDRKRTIAVADKYVVVLFVDPHIIGVVTELDPPDRHEIVAAQYAHRAVARVCHIDAVGKGHVSDTLWLTEAADRAQHLPRCQIDDAEAIVAEFCNKQPLALYIDAEVIDPAADIAERDFCFEREGCCRRLCQSYDRRQQG